jgi:four helix bundle protein
MATGIESLVVFQKSFSLAMDIFKSSKEFPKEERYSLTDQIRWSSRSVCANLAETYRKRMYEAHFISKLSDADMENTETRIWLKFCLSCEYLSESKYQELIMKNQEVGRMLDHMIKNPTKFQRNW